MELSVSDSAGSPVAKNRPKRQLKADIYLTTDSNGRVFFCGFFIPVVIFPSSERIEPATI